METLELKVKRKYRAATYTIGTMFVDGAQISETWKDIPGYEGIYQASNFGRIRSKDRIVINKYGIGAILKGVIRVPSYHKKKNKTRESIGLSKEGKVKYYSLPKLIAITFIGECPQGYEVDHIDENPLNNHVENLRYLSHFDNSSRSNKGVFRKTNGNVMENNPRSKSVIGYEDGEEVVVYKCAKYLTKIYGINYSTVRYKLQNGGIKIGNIYFKYED